MSLYGRRQDRGVEEAKTLRGAWSAIFAMALGVVVLILGEMLPASLLTAIAADLLITEGMAGQAVATTAFAAVFSSLLMAPATRRLDRRTVLLSLTVLFLASNLMVGFAVNYQMLLVGRLLLGVGLGGFWSMAASVATRLAPQGMAPRALSIIYGGVSVAMVAAIPLGTYLGGITGWRGMFIATAALALIALVWQAITLPSILPTGQLRLAGLIDLFKRPQLNIGNASTFLVYGAHFTFFTYLRPLLERLAGYGDHGVATVLLGFGLASMAGTAISSVLIRANFRLTLAAMPLIMAILAAGLVTWADSPVTVFAFVVCWGLAFGVVPVSWATWLTRAAPDALESANGLRVAGIQLAISVGGSIGGLLLDAYDPRAPLIGAGSVALVATALILAKLRLPPDSDVRRTD